MKKSYKTVEKEASAYHEEKRSRFLSCIFPVWSEEEALDLIEKTKAKYPDSSHTVFAYSIDTEALIQRFSDDSEPSGTAGIPVLEVIKRNNLENVLITVTRYFGGILLGAPGLTRSYSKAASLAVENSSVVAMILCDVITFTLDYSFFGKVQNMIGNTGYFVSNIKYELDVEIEVVVPEEKAEEFTGLMVDICFGSCIYETRRKTYYSY